jgi:AraC family ethanolamine operon transcriptional activator
MRAMDSHAPLAPAGAMLSRTAFADVDEQAAALRGWNQTYLQLTRGAFGGEMRQLQFAGMRLFVESLRESVYQTGRIGNGALALGLPLRLEGESVFCGAPCAAGALHVFSGGSGFEFRSSRRHVMLGLELDAAAWRRCVEHDPVSGQQSAIGPQAGLQQHDAAALASLKQGLVVLFSNVETKPEVFASAAVQARVLDNVLEQVGDLLACPAPPGNAHSHWAVTQRARDIIHAQLDSPPTVLALCEQLGVSRRTLQNCFQTVLGVSPLSYLRAVRLNAARQALKTAASVTAAATDLGFWHFGHFAHDYQQMFGELPSEAFRRYH